MSIDDSPISSPKQLIADEDDDNIPVKKKGKKGRKPKKNSDSTSTRKVKFLFKFMPGAAKSSYGISVGEMAGLPKQLLDKAEIQSENFSKSLDSIREFKKKYDQSNQLLQEQEQQPNKMMEMD
ncbi:dna mismatch repair protein [Stylonychia lemnae]|uniref:Dna mismatch repair protein n=1 Tax=Stylonychia lemnae TaxID=5949 RepID=A0A078B0L0_STYLE|nr:dna mismatch repair protein [Stylonychia lemnae]|eukprot:CDW86643.1 dna mismatch repair protein [Stylonychia lemnae]